MIDSHDSNDIPQLESLDRVTEAFPFYFKSDTYIISFATMGWR